MRLLTLATLTAPALGGNILWDGRFNDLSSSLDLNRWSWSNQVGPYQYYIHGSSPVTAYVNLSPSYKNPFDAGSKQGAKITLDRTAYWNGQNMRRTELIPQTTAPINRGKVYYHFSLMRKDVNAPATTREHQIAFFESHFTELKSGWLSGSPGTEDTKLRWCVSGQTHWSVEWEADVWHNFAYEIDFSAGTVGLWHSENGEPLKRVVDPVRTSASSDGKDWHVGVLELPRSGYNDFDEDFYFSGVYIENGEITTSVSGPGSEGVGTGNGGGNNSTVPATTLVTSTTRLPTTTTSAAPAVTSTASSGGCTAAQWAQCDGIGFNGCKTCAAGLTCKFLNDYYSQCV